jgi:hypothetical protein
MYCPNCASPIDGARFCRSCGANVSLVPQALSGELTTANTEVDQRGRRRKEPSIEKATTTIFIGIGFLLTAIIVHFFIPAGLFWGWSFLIPAFACLGDGIGLYMRWKANQKQQQFPQTFPPYQPDRAPQVIASTTSKISQPESSVTETTTKHLDLGRRSE